MRRRKERLEREVEKTGASMARIPFSFPSFPASPFPFFSLLFLPCPLSPPHSPPFFPFGHNLVMYSDQAGLELVTILQGKNSNHLIPSSLL